MTIDDTTRGLDQQTALGALEPVQPSISSADPPSDHGAAARAQDLMRQSLMATDPIEQRRLNEQATLAFEEAHRPQAADDAPQPTSDPATDALIEAGMDRSLAIDNVEALARLATEYGRELQWVEQESGPDGREAHLDRGAEAIRSAMGQGRFDDAMDTICRGVEIWSQRMGDPELAAKIDRAGLLSSRQLFAQYLLISQQLVASAKPS